MYDPIAYYYALTHATLTEDIPFVLAQAATSPGVLLELGCGNGRLLRPLVAAGHQVVGVDNSAAMLALAAADSTGGHIVLADMRELPFGGRPFGLALIPYNTVLHLTDSGFALTLAGLRRCLQVGGRLVIDVVNPHLLAATPDVRTPQLEQTLYNPATGKKIQQLSASWLDGEAQIFWVDWLFKEGGRQTAVTMAYYYRYLHQFQLALMAAHFELTAVYGSYSQGRFSERSDRLLLVASLKE